MRAHPVVIPMKSPFESAKRRSTEAENVRVEIALSNGITGWGEGSPADYVTGETPESVTHGIEAAAEALQGIDASRVTQWDGLLGEVLSGQPTARSAMEMALLDALARGYGVPLWVYLGGAVGEVRSDLTIPISTAEEAGRLAGEAAGFGYRSLKIKVGGPDRDADLARVLAVSGAAPGAGIRLDANQGFQAKEALEFLAACERHGVPVELMEQPVHRDDWDSLAEVTRGSAVPVIADEAVVDAAAALRLAATGAAHGINIKVAKAGMLGALRIVSIAQAGGLRLMIGCMLESLLGIGGGVHLACGTGAFDFLDLDSHTLIGLKANGIPFSQAGDILQVPTEVAGLGWLPKAEG